MIYRYRYLKTNYFLFEPALSRECSPLVNGVDLSPYSTTGIHYTVSLTTAALSEVSYKFKLFN